MAFVLPGCPDIDPWSEPRDRPQIRYVRMAELKPDRLGIEYFLRVLDWGSHFHDADGFLSEFDIYPGPTEYAFLQKEWSKMARGFKRLTKAVLLKTIYPERYDGEYSKGEIEAGWRVAEEIFSHGPQFEGDDYCRWVTLLNYMVPCDLSDPEADYSVVEMCESLYHYARYSQALNRENLEGN